MSRYASDLQETKNRKDYQSGLDRAVAIQQEAKSYKEAIGKGLIDQTGSPYFQMGIRESYGRVTANRRDEDIRAALAQDRSLDEATSLDKFDAAYANAGKAWDAANLPEGQQDQYFTSGFAGRSQSLQSNARSQFVHVIGSNLKNQSITSVYADTKSHVRDTIANAPPDKIMEQLHMMMDGYDSIGMDSEMVEKSVLRALGDLALETPGGDRKVAALIPLLKSAAGGLVVDAAGGKNAEYAREVTLGVARQRAEQEHRQNAEITLDRETRTRDVSGTAMQRLLSNPGADTRDLEIAVRDIPEAVASIQQARRIAQGSGQYDDDAIRSELFNGIWTGKTNERNILKAYNAHGGHGLTLETANHLIGEFRQRLAFDRAEQRQDQMQAVENRRSAAEARLERAEQRRTYRDLVSDPLFTNVRANVKDQFVSHNSYYPGADASQVADAEAQLTKAWVVWRNSDAGSQAGPSDAIDWLQKQSTAIVTLLRSKTDDGRRTNDHVRAAQQAGAPPRVVPKIVPPVAPDLASQAVGWLQKQSHAITASLHDGSSTGPTVNEHQSDAKQDAARPQVSSRVLTPEDLAARAQGTLTPHAKQMLQAHGVPPDARAIADFFLSQAKMHQ